MPSWAIGYYKPWLMLNCADLFFLAVFMVTILINSTTFYCQLHVAFLEADRIFAKTYVHTQQIYIQRSAWSTWMPSWYLHPGFSILQGIPFVPIQICQEKNCKVYFKLFESRTAISLTRKHSSEIGHRSGNIVHCFWLLQAVRWWTRANITHNISLSSPLVFQRKPDRSISVIQRRVVSAWRALDSG